MNKSTIFGILVALSAVACGGEAGFGYGGLSQPYMANNSPNYQFGVNVNASHLQCDRSNSNQVCSIPERKNIQVALLPEIVNTHIVEVGTVVTAIREKLDSNWTLTTASSDTELLPTQTRLLLQTGTCGSSYSNNIDGYSCVDFVSPHALTEGVAPGVNTPVGSYQTHGACIATIDVADINNKMATTTERTRLRKHAWAHAILTCMGLGSRNDAGSNGVYSRRSILHTTILRGLTDGEACRANSYNNTDNDDFSYSPTTCAVN